MHLKTVILVISATAGLVSAQPHGHRHVHVKRDTVVTMTACTVLGQNTILSPAECTAGVDANKYSYVGPAPTDASVAFFESTSSSSTPTPTPTPTPSSTSTSSSSSSSSSAPAPSTPAKSTVSGGGGADSPFPDGQLDCGTVPTQYGAINVDYLGLGGWIGLQQVDGSMTVTSTGTSGSTCTDGYMCSYACGPGYQKSQWPQNQPANGQSVGGLQCKNGKLFLTNPNYQTICIKGTGVSQVQNKLGANVAVCRTDYPGTEAETVPMDVSGGATLDLTCPNSSNYYSWGGKATSAQYYVNPKGVMASDGCQWGTAGSGMGNDAPLNIGISTDANGQSWFALLPNTPTNTHSTLDFNIDIVGDFGGDKCSYSNGQYCMNGNCNSAGVTCHLASGTGTFVFS